jgi:hypothetical protein
VIQIQTRVIIDFFGFRKCIFDPISGELLPGYKKVEKRKHDRGGQFDSSALDPPSKNNSNSADPEQSNRKKTAESSVKTRFAFTLCSPILEAFLSPRNPGGVSRTMKYFLYI